ncbi:class E sortase [Actinoplanes sp. NPDC051411]|uniref:class E sortase n=1 Tax=Actinoplanes sp. NPDC051411 TaxID=3155522 RepID=UPI00343FD995
MADNNSGRHRAPDGEANTAYIPRITDASPDGVPGGPLAPPIGLGSAAEQPPAVRGEHSPTAAAAPQGPADAAPPAADTAILEADEEIRRRVAAARALPQPAAPSGPASAAGEKTADEVSAAAAAARSRQAGPPTELPPGEFDFFAAGHAAQLAAQAQAAQAQQQAQAQPAPAQAALAQAGPAQATRPQTQQQPQIQPAQIPPAQIQPAQIQPAGRLQPQVPQSQAQLQHPQGQPPTRLQVQPGQSQFAQAQPAQSQPAPAAGHAQPMSGQSASMPAQPVSPQAQGRPTAAQPMPAQPMPGQSLSAQAQPMPGQPLSAQAQPTSAQPMLGQPMFPQAQQTSGQPMSTQAQPTSGQPMPGQPLSAQAQPMSAQAQAAASQSARPGLAPPARPQVTHTTAPVSPTPQLQSPAETQQLPAPVGAAASRSAGPQAVSVPANQLAFAQAGSGSTNGRSAPQGYGSVNGQEGAQGYGQVAAPGYGAGQAGEPGYGHSNGQPGGAPAQGATAGQPAYGLVGGQAAAPSQGSANGHSAPELNALANGAYPANGSNGHGQPEPARTGGSPYGSPVAAASSGLGTASRPAGTAPDGLGPSRRSSEGGFQPNPSTATPTSPGTFGSRTAGGPNGAPGLRNPSSTVPGRGSAVPGGPGGAPGPGSEDPAATRQLPAPDVSKTQVNGAKARGLWDRPETNFIEQPSGGLGFADGRQDPSETAIIRTADAPTGLLPSLRKPTRKVGVPGAAAEAAKAAADPDAVLGAVPVTEVRPGNPDEDEVPAEDGEPKRGEKVVKLRPEQTEDGYESVYSKLTRPTLGSRIRGGIRVSGELMITFGLIVLLFAGYEIYGNGAKVQSEQDSLNSKLDQDWADPTVGPTKAGPAAPGDSLVGRLYIPKFAKEWVVVNGVLPDNIKYAPGHYPDTAMPGQIGNFSVAGHRIPKIFWRINELKNGDVIAVETRDSWFIYKVYNQEIVSPSAVQVVEPVPDQPGVKPTKAVLTLTTCNPKGNNYQRLIVHAQLASQVKRDSTKPDAGMPAEMKAKY